MLNRVDQERIIRSSHSAEFLVRHLQELTQSANPLLADIALELQQHAIQIEQRLNRMVCLVVEERKAAV